MEWKYRDLDLQAQREFVGERLVYQAVCWTCSGKGYTIEIEDRFTARFVKRACPDCEGKGWYWLEIKNNYK